MASPDLGGSQDAEHVAECKRRKQMTMKAAQVSTPTPKRRHIQKQDESAAVLFCLNKAESFLSPGKDSEFSGCQPSGRFQSLAEHSYFQLALRPLVCEPEQLAPVAELSAPMVIPALPFRIDARGTTLSLSGLSSFCSLKEEKGHVCLHGITCSRPCAHVPKS